MGTTSLQVCMDSSDDHWLQGTISEEGTDQPLDSSSDDILVACSGTLVERRLKPQHDQSPKCPRCESTHTKFCYYNNYSLSQPRYFCKTCRRYWTKGGTLRNIPVGGGCHRKNKKVFSNSKKKNNSNEDNNNNCSGHHHLLPSSSSQPNNNNVGLMSSSSGFSFYDLSSRGNPNLTDLCISFPEVPLTSLSSNGLRYWTSDAANPVFVLENNPTTPSDFVKENNYYYMGHGENNFDGVDVTDGELMTLHNGNVCSPFVMCSSLDHHGMSVSTSVNKDNVPCDQMQYDQNHHHHHLMDDQSYQYQVDNVKRISTSLEEIKDHSFGYSFGGLGSLIGLMNGYGSSATYPLV